MSKRIVALVGALAVVSSVLLVFAVRSRADQPGQRASARSESRSASIPPGADELTVLREEVSALRRNQERLASATLAAANRNDATQPTPAPAAENAGEYAEDRGAYLDRWTTFLAADFEAQEVDASWAPRREAELHSSVAAAEYPATRLLDVRCRAKFCVMRVEHADLRAMEAFTGSYYRSAAVENEVMLSHSENDDGTLATIYVSRDGQALPRDEYATARAGDPG